MDITQIKQYIDNALRHTTARGKELEKNQDDPEFQVLVKLGSTLKVAQEYSKELRKIQETKGL